MGRIIENVIAGIIIVVFYLFLAWMFSWPPFGAPGTVRADGIRHFTDRDGGLPALTKWCEKQGGHMLGYDCKVD